MCAEACCRWIVWLYAGCDLAVARVALLTAVIDFFTTASCFLLFSVKLVEDIHKQRLLALKIVPHPVEPVPPVGEKKDVLDLVKREVL